MAYFLPRNVTDDNSAATRWRPQGLRVARPLVGTYVVSALAVTAAVGMGSIFLALGAQIARDVVGTADILLIVQCCRSPIW